MDPSLGVYTPPPPLPPKKKNHNFPNLIELTNGNWYYLHEFINFTMHKTQHETLIIMKKSCEILYITESIW